MKSETAQFGKEETKDEQIFYFSKGIPGFEEHTEFMMIDLPDAPFAYLQSVKESQISLLITDPFIFFPNYEFDLSERVVEELNLGSSFLIRCIVTLKQDVSQSTINLLAPIVFNLDNHTARQVILHSSEYQSRHLLWSGESESSPDNKAGE